MTDTHGASPNPTPTNQTPVAAAEPPAQPKRRRRRGWLWTGVIALVALLAVVGASLGGVIHPLQLVSKLPIPTSHNKAFATPSHTPTPTPGSLRWKVDPFSFVKHPGVETIPESSLQIVNGVAYAETDTFTINNNRADPTQQYGSNGVIYAIDVANGVQRWKITLPFDASKMEIADGVLYLTVPPSTAHLYNPDPSSIYAVDLKTGSIRWKASVTGLVGLYSEAGGVIYVTTVKPQDTFQDGVVVGITTSYVYALSANDGTVRWRVTIGNGGDARFPPQVIGNIVYVNDLGNPGSIYALNAADGSLQWKAGVGEGEGSVQIVANDTIYVTALFGNLGNHLFALNTHDGSLRWFFGSGGYPILSNGVLYLASDDGNIYALDPTDGSQQWSYSTVGSVSPPLLVGNVIYACADDLAGHNFLYAVNANNGSPLWKFPTPGPVFDMPTIANGVVYIAPYFKDNHLYAVNARTGVLLWKFATQDSVDGAPIVTGEGAYVITAEGYLYAINT